MLERALVAAVAEPDIALYIPRPGRRRKEGLVPIARACANYFKKTWGAATILYAFSPSSRGLWYEATPI